MAACGRLAAVLGLLLLAAACVARPGDVDEVRVDSRTYDFIDELMDGKAGTPQRVGAVLALPEQGVARPPYPAMVLLHTSNGQGSQDWLYMKRLRALGIAVLAIDSFTARGVSDTVRDQTLVSTASTLADAYGGLRYLAADPRIDPKRIGVWGFSKGAIAALYAAYRPIRERLSPDGRRFALHVAYYPWCGLALRRPVTTGAPVLIETGALDDLVPPARCARLIAATRGPDGPSRMQLVVLPGARHAFDHPMLALFGDIAITAPSPAACTLKQLADGSFVETDSGLAIDHTNEKDVLALCSHGGSAGGNEAAADAAYARTLAFLRAGGFLPDDRSLGNASGEGDAVGDLAGVAETDAPLDGNVKP